MVQGVVLLHTGWPGGLQILSNEEKKFLFCFYVKPGPQDYRVVTWVAA